MFDFFLVYPITFMIGCGFAAASRWESVKKAALRATGLSAFFGGLASLIYLPESWELPAGFVKFFLLAAFWAGSVGLLGACVVSTMRFVLRELKQ